MIGGTDLTTVHKYVLDAASYKAELSNVAKEIRAANKAAADLAVVERELGKRAAEATAFWKEQASAVSAATTATKAASDSNKKLLATYKDFSAAARDTIGILKGIAGGFDRAVDTGFKYSNLQRNLKISIDDAAKSTKGLVDNMSLAMASSRASAFGLEYTSQQFGDIAGAAAIAAKRMGTDIPSAINDIITGIARASPKILDNMGIIVKADDAYREWATTHRKLGMSVAQTIKSMTAQEKQAAYSAAALKALNKIAAGGQLVVKDLGGAWKQFTTTLTNVKLAILGSGSSSSGLVGAFKMLNEAGQGMESWVKATPLDTARLKLRDLQVKRDQQTRVNVWGLGNVMSARIAQTDKEIEATRRQIAELTRIGNIAKGSKLATGMLFGGEWMATSSPSSPRRAVGKRRRKRADTSAARAQRASDRDDAAEARDALSFDRRIFRAGKRFADQDARANQRKRDTDAKFAAAMTDEQAVKHQRLVKLYGEERAIQLELHQIEQQRYTQMKELGISALSGMATATIDAAAAAIEGGASFGAAMQQILKSTLMMISKQATVEAIKETALGFGKLGATWGIPNPAATAHFTSAAMWGGVGIAAGAAGIAIPSASTGSSAGSGAAAGANTGSSMGAYSGVGQRAPRDKQPIIVNLRYDRESPAQAAVAALKLTASISRQDMGFAA